MKYIITGGAGNISKPLALALLEAGKDVTVIGRSAENLKALTDKGAKAAIGSVEDVEFLRATFKGADAVYTMIPPNHNPTDWKAYIGQIGQNFADALHSSGVKHVVNLSSIGAHLPDGCGPVSGLYRAEKALNTLTDIAILHLRPGFFYYNFLGNVSMVKQMQIIGGNYGNAETKMVLADTGDIASVAAEALQELNFKGHTIRYIASDERNAGDVAKTFGQAIGKPELPWVEFTDEQTLQGLQQAGLAPELAKNYAEMGAAIRTGIMQEDYWKNKPELSKTKLEDFAPVFAQVYQSN
jgi:uncharacterized protein YbjT (DUF2867 family)